MNGLSIYALIIGVIYMLIQIRLYKAWLAIPDSVVKDNFQPQTSTVIIIPARNEADNIKSCILSILGQNYPKELMQLIIVDDHSTDRTLEFARSFDDSRINVIALEDLQLGESLSPKKQALNIGIRQSEAELIITTDADCIAEPNWIKTIVHMFETQRVDMIAGPVLFDPLNSRFERFQALDFVGMMGITAAGIHSGKFHMCNGANLAFSRQSFDKVDGYRGTEQIASGDDILLAQKYVQHSSLKIGFLKSNEGIIKTKPVNSLIDFLKQRLRWGAKSEHYSEKQIIWIQFVVLITCLSLVAFIFLGLVFHKYHWMKYLMATGVLLLLKSTADFIALRTYSNYFNRQSLMKTFFYSQFAHIFYIAIVGLLSVFVRKHEWKGRVLR